MLDSGETVLGTVDLTDKALVLEANSRERAERGQSILAELGGTLLGPPLMKIETLEQAMAKREFERHQDEASDIPADLQMKLVHATLTDHYRKTLDEPIPALGDLSPRAAAKTTAGRRKVVDWLKHIENQSKSGRQSDDPMTSYDFTWLWRDLGLEKLRR